MDRLRSNGLSAIPPWLVLGLSLEAAATGIASAHLAERVADRLLAWSRRRREEGFAPVRAAWNARCYRRGEPAPLGLACGRRHTGTVGGLDEGGAFLIDGATLPL